MNSPLSSAERFARFAAQFCGLRLEAFQHVIAREVFTDRRELLVMLPRGNGKTTLFAAVGLFALLSTREPAIYVCAASRDQARLLFEQAKRMVRGHPELEARQTRAMVLYRDAYRCQLCHRAAAEVDHIQPVIDGGSDDPANLRSLCHDCHAGR